MSDQSEAPVGSLLAIDLGLRIGWALYSDRGRLLKYGSQHFGTRDQLKRAASSILSRYPDVRRVVIEGGGDVALPWLREGERRGMDVIQIHAGLWRERLLLPRDRRSGDRAKQSADLVARRVIEWSGAPRPTSLRHDAAEAILIGLWAARESGLAADFPG